MTRDEYLKNKRIEVLETIKPMCESFKIENYDYVFNDKYSEYLILENTKICCTGNSIYGVVVELVGYIFIQYFNKVYLGAFQTQTFNQIKKYWVKD